MGYTWGVDSPHLTKYEQISNWTVLLDILQFLEFPKQVDSKQQNATRMCYMRFYYKTTVERGGNFLICQVSASGNQNVQATSQSPLPL